jgi:hypothetical protein
MNVLQGVGHPLGLPAGKGGGTSYENQFHDSLISSGRAAVEDQAQNWRKSLCNNQLRMAGKLLDVIFITLPDFLFGLYFAGNQTCDT